MAGSWLPAAAAPPGRVRPAPQHGGQAGPGWARPTCHDGPGRASGTLQTGPGGAGRVAGQAGGGRGGAAAPAPPLRPGQPPRQAGQVSTSPVQRSAVLQALLRGVAQQGGGQAAGQRGRGEAGQAAEAAHTGVPGGLQ